MIAAPCTRTAIDREMIVLPRAVVVLLGLGLAGKVVGIDNESDQVP